jgi:hypothetical protein
MATTTNFGWDTPDDTDLVKDGAAAIRTLGSSIDTSFVDLKGGTTDQVLAKNSGTDLDFKWVTDATGMANPMTTTGDSIYSSSGSTPARLGIGSTGQVLTVAGGVPSWATPTSPAYVGALAYLTSNQSITTATTTSIDWTAESFDTDGFHSTVTNTNRFTIPAGLGGKYLIVISCQWLQGISDLQEVYLEKNGAGIISRYEGSQGQSVGYNQNLIYVTDLVATDYVQAQVKQGAGFSVSVKGGVTRSYMSIQRLAA